MTTSTQRKWQEQFGNDWDIPTAIDTLVDSGYLKDVSWHNDAFPLFQRKSKENGQLVELGVEHPDPSKRELGAERFYVVCRTEDREYDGCPHLSTDDLGEALSKFKEMAKE